MDYFISKLKFKEKRGIYKLYIPSLDFYVKMPSLIFLRNVKKSVLACFCILMQIILKTKSVLVSRQKFLKEKRTE